LRRGDTFEARKILERLIQIEPQMAKAHNALCVLELRDGRLEQAERECLEATRLNADNAGAWVNLGSVYINAKKYDETREVAEKALSIQPKNVEAEYLLAVVFANLGTLDLAEQHLKRGLAISPNHAGLRQLKKQITDRPPNP
jgi:tetratricopeptide (TPR) repeat protein